MNSQPQSRLLQETYQGLESRYGIVDLETNSSSSRTNPRNR